MSIRALTTSVLALTAIGLAVLAWPQAFGLSRSFVIAQLISLRGLTAIAALVLALVFFVIAVRAPAVRHFVASICVLLILFAGSNVVVLTDRGFEERAFTTAGASGVTVLSWNTLGGAPGADAIARLALDSDAEVVSLPETTEGLGTEVARIMASAGHPMSVVTLAYDHESTAHSTTLLISLKLGEYTFDARSHTTAVLPTVVASPRTGSGPTIVAAHTLAPIPPMMLAWQDDLTWVADACAGDNVIVAGDFNATLDHFEGLPHGTGATLGRCLDAAQTSHSAGAGTWPTALPPALGSPIDHILATPNWRVSGVRVLQSHDQDGSDHRPILVELTPVP